MTQKVPDPLESGHIEGQNPNTPQRAPSHTAYYTRRHKASYSWLAVFCLSAILLLSLILFAILESS